MSTQQLREAAGQEVESKPKSKVTELSQQLDRLKKQMELALPKHMTADRMARLVLTCFGTNEKLYKCTFQSVAAAVMTASQLGLEIGVGGQGYLIPYRDKATFVPGWQGLMDLCSRAGRATAWTGAVFEGDKFEWEQGDKPYIKHLPCGENDPKKLLHAWAVGRVNGAEWPTIEVWPASRLESHRSKNNKVGSDHYSYQHWEMYCRKVVLLQVLKYMPKSVELTAAIDLSGREDEALTIDGDFVVVNQDEAATAGEGTDG